jgi:hypothetical protein
MRMPSEFAGKLQARSGLGVLEAELLAETAASLGRAGREVELSLERLRAFDAGAPDDGDRRDLVRAAARAVWAYWVQREACGLVDHRQVIRDQRIPREVLNRVGLL